MKTETTKINLPPVSEFEQLYLHQNKCCVICGSREYLSNMTVDAAQGLICPKCTVILNRANRNPEILQRAAEYLCGMGV